MLYTFGYAGMRSDEFIAKMQENSIRLVIDVRTSAVSRMDWANKMRLKELLHANGISYRHYPGLGGRPKDPTLYTDGKVDYDKLIGSMEFIESINRVAEGVRTMRKMKKTINIVFLCAERNKEDCHRWLAVAKALKALHFKVQEIER